VDLEQRAQQRRVVMLVGQVGRRRGGHDRGRPGWSRGCVGQCMSPPHACGGRGLAPGPGGLCGSPPPPLILQPFPLRWRGSWVYGSAGSPRNCPALFTCQQPKGPLRVDVKTLIQPLLSRPLALREEAPLSSPALACRPHSMGCKQEGSTRWVWEKPGVERSGRQPRARMFRELGAGAVHACLLLSPPLTSPVQRDCGGDKTAHVNAGCHLYSSPARAGYRFHLRPFKHYGGLQDRSC
jgi:hypothetical protein